VLSFFVFRITSLAIDNYFIIKVMTLVFEAFVNLLFDVTDIIRYRYWFTQVSLKCKVREFTDVC